MSEKNADLVKVADALGDLTDGLRDAREKESDPDKIKAINNELIEANHRITMVGALLFHQRTAAITAAADKVASGTAAVEKAITDLENINKFIKAVSGFLALVDKAIDVAKLAAI